MPEGQSEHPLRPRLTQLVLDEIYCGDDCVLMSVEPNSLCWLSGRLVASCTGAAWCQVLLPFTHLRQVTPGGVDGLYARHLAEHILPGELVEILRACRRALAPGAPLVFVTPNPGTLTVGAHTFWLDPQHLRPIPPDLFRFYLEVEGFADVAVRTFEPTERRLSEEVPAGPIRENVKLLNETLFGDRDYAVIGRAPAR